MQNAGVQRRGVLPLRVRVSACSGGSAMGRLFAIITAAMVLFWAGRVPADVVKVGAGPVERDMLARIGCPLELEAEGVDGADRRFAPRHDLSGSGFGTGWVHQLWILPRHACWAS